VLSGSCSQATRRQVAIHGQDHPVLEIDIDKVITGAQTAQQVTGWLLAQDDPVPMAYSSADPATVAAAQVHYGRDETAEHVERLFVSVAQALVAAGIRKIVTAGGETSGAVEDGLHLQQLDIGPEIAPGVPAVREPRSGL